MLWGCSSGALKEMGDFDRVGTPNNYMLAGWCVCTSYSTKLTSLTYHICSPSLVANLWDVTDRDIDKFAQTVFDKMGLTSADVGKTRSQRMSVVAAVAQSRKSCKLKYLTGAAPVIYGIPFYL
jgi:separase